MLSDGLEEASFAKRDDAPTPDMIDSVITTVTNERNVNASNIPSQVAGFSFTLLLFQTASWPLETRRKNLVV